MSQKWCYRCQSYHETDAAVCPQCGANLMDHHPMSPEGKRETAQRLAASRTRSRSDEILNHPGRQLIAVSKIIFWVVFIFSIVLSILWLGVLGPYAGPGAVFLCLLTVLIGLVVAWINSIMLRAFGSLVDDVETIKESLRK